MLGIGELEFGVTSVEDEACATRLCSHTFSVGLILEPREAICSKIQVYDVAVEYNN